MKFIVTPQIPKIFLFASDRDSQTENHAFVAWEEHDSLM